MRFERIPFISSAVWSVAAGAYLLLTPLTLHEITASGFADGSYVAEETTRQVSWHQAQGAWGVLILAIFSSLFILLASLAVKERYLPLLAISLVTTALVLLAGFSIGLFYLPAVLLVWLGWLGVVLHRLLRGRKSASP